MPHDCIYPCIVSHQNCPAVGFAADILAQGGATPRNGSKTDNAHPPIHPTKHADHLQVGSMYSLTGHNADIPLLSRPKAKHSVW